MSYESQKKLKAFHLFVNSMSGKLKPNPKLSVNSNDV
jgi:hypothetical protein